MKKIVENVPERDKRGNTEVEIEEFYKSIEAAEDAFMGTVDEIKRHLPIIKF